MALPACSSRGRCPFRGPQQRQGRRQLQQPRRATQPSHHPHPSSASCCSRQGQGQLPHCKPGWQGGLPAVCMQAWQFCCSAEPRLTTSMHLIPGAAVVDDVSLCCIACTPCRSPSGRARMSCAQQGEQQRWRAHSSSGSSCEEDAVCRCLPGNGLRRAAAAAAPAGWAAAAGVCWAGQQRQRSWQRSWQRWPARILLTAWLCPPAVALIFDCCKLTSPLQCTSQCVLVAPTGGRNDSFASYT